MFKIPLKFRWVYKHLSASELSNDCSFDLCLSDLFSSNTARFLDFYSEQGVKLAIRRYGFVAKLRELGYEQIDLRFGVREDGSHFLVVFEPPYDETRVIAELVVRKTAHEDIFPVLKVEWLCLQNPRGKFTEQKPQLPGQRFPGLGLGQDVLSVIILMALRLKLQALINVADHFHNACIYANNFHFFDPMDSARLIALTDLMKEENLSLSQMAWALEKGHVFVKGETTPYRWQSAAQILPLRTALESRFASDAFKDAVAAARKNTHFVYRK